MNFFDYITDKRTPEGQKVMFFIPLIIIVIFSLVIVGFLFGDLAIALAVVYLLAIMYWPYRKYRVKLAEEILKNLEGR